MSEKSERRAISHNNCRIRFVLKERTADYSTVCAVVLAKYGLE